MYEVLNNLVGGLTGKGFTLFLFCLYLGVLAAGALAVYERRTLGAFVRSLISSGALSPETAKTLAELGYEKKSAVQRGLRGKGIYAGTVYEASEEPEFDREDHAMPIYREDFDEKTARFYIPEVLKYRAEVRFEKKGTHVMALVLGALLLGAAILALLIFRERIVELLQQYLAAMHA